MELIEKLKARGLKKTPIRKELLSLLNNANEALSQNQLEQLLGEGYNRVSIYRALIDLENSGLIHKAFDSEGRTKFALCADTCTTHHHKDSHAHFTCTNCTSTFCIQSVKHEPLDLLGYQINEVSILVKGLCKNCQNKM